MKTLPPPFDTSTTDTAASAMLSTGARLRNATQLSLVLPGDSYSQGGTESPARASSNWDDLDDPDAMGYPLNDLEAVDAADQFPLNSEAQTGQIMESAKCSSSSGNNIRTPGFSAALMFNFFEDPVAFRRSYVDITGSIVAALYLSVLIQQTSEHDPEGEHEGWLPHSLNDWLELSGMQIWELRVARRNLLDKGFIEEIKAGDPLQTCVRVITLEVMKAMDAQARKTFPHLDYTINNQAPRPPMEVVASKPKKSRAKKAAATS